MLKSYNKQSKCLCFTNTGRLLLTPHDGFSRQRGGSVLPGPLHPGDGCFGVHGQGAGGEAALQLSRPARHLHLNALKTLQDPGTAHGGNAQDSGKILLSRFIGPRVNYPIFLSSLYYIIIIIIINCKWVCTRWQWYYNTQYNTIHKKHKITHTHSKQYTTQKLQTQ